MWRNLKELLKKPQRRDFGKENSKRRLQRRDFEEETSKRRLRKISERGLQRARSEWPETQTRWKFKRKEKRLGLECIKVWWSNRCLASVLARKRIHWHEASVIGCNWLTSGCILDQDSWWPRDQLVGSRWSQKLCSKLSGHWLLAKQRAQWVQRVPLQKDRQKVH